MKNTPIILTITSLSIGIALAITVGSSYILFERQKNLEQMMFRMRDDQLESLNQHVGVAGAQIIERVVSNAQVWRPVQDKVKDTVVQVFAQIAETDLLQPYKTPAQYPATGSGFFINGDGEFITNAHVVNQAKSMWIQIPSLGKRTIDVELIGLSPERDIALMKVTDAGLAEIKQELGSVPYLELGDSDSVRRSDEVLALGYPLGMQSVKSTTGVISGREQHFLQMSAAINPGNSGGPLLNIDGKVIGINSAGILQAQNVGYAIPISDLKIVLDDLRTVKLLRKPFLGVLFNNATDALTEYLGNPKPGGCYVVEVVKGSTLDKAGVKSGDMIYEINNHRLDIYGEMSVTWSEDKVSIVDYVGRLSVGENINLVVYRKGTRKDLNVTFSQAKRPGTRKVYPGFEDLDYEVFGGMVVMPLTLNHVKGLMNAAPGLSRYTEMKHQGEKTLIITHIFPNSHLYRARTLAVGATINELNGVKVSTLEEFRGALKKGKNNRFFTVKASDNVARASDNIFVTLLMKDVLDQEMDLLKAYRYPLSVTAREMLNIGSLQPQVKGALSAAVTA